MDITIDQQVALDRALVPHASRLRNGKSNFQLRLNLKSKELTLQVVYDILKLTPFYKAFFVTTDVPEIYIELGHSGEIKMITYLNINKLHQPWRSFAAVINKCLSGKSTGYDSLRLSQDQILYGMYHKKNVDFATLCGRILFIRHQNTQQYGVILPIELTNKAIRNSKSYKEYYAIASGAEPP
nr:hypothetical protein [Tanacetum cinerariifolium]